MKKIILMCFMFLGISGCSTVAESTNMLSDEKIKTETAGVLGYSSDEITITKKQVQGGNTYVNLKTKDKKEFTCVIDGGNVLSMWMVNSPSCSRKGESINTNPFQR